MKRSYLIYIVLGLGLVAYTSWLTWFAATGVKYIEHETAQAAEVAANIAWLDEGRLDVKVIKAEGDSNTMWSGEIVSGYVLVDTAAPFEDIQARDFIVYRDSRGKLICHSAREQTSDGSWYMSGDGNSRRDRELATPHNYIGTMYKKTVWSY